MKAFDIAWSVLKADSVAVGSSETPLGEGSYRQVFPNRREQNEVIKLPHMGGQQMTNIAAMDALAQLGYPVMPEKPVAAYKFGGVGFKGPYAGTTQQRANAVVYDEGLRMENDPDTTHAERVDFQNQFRDTVQNPLIAYGPIQDPLMQAIGVSDVREGNTGVYDDGMKAIDFEVSKLGAYREPTYRGDARWAATLGRLGDWLKVPNEQRRSFVNLYGDTSRFEPWNESRDNRTGYLGTQEELYRRGLRNLQLMSDMIDNPEQRRLFEFADDEGRQRLATEEWRDKIMRRRNSDTPI